MREKDSFEHKIINDLLKQHQIQFHTVWQSISTHTMIQAVENGLGICAISGQAAQAALKDGRISQFFVEDTFLSREAYIVYFQNKLLTKPARDFIGMCQNISVEDGVDNGSQRQ